MHLQLASVFENFVVVHKNKASDWELLILNVSIVPYLLPLFFYILKVMKRSSSKWINWSNLSSTTSKYRIFVMVTTLRLGTTYSIGMTTSFPYTNLNGVCHVNFLHVVWYSHSTTEILWSQSSLLMLQTLVSAFSRIVLNASTTPYACEWYGVVFLCSIWNSSVSSSIN